MLADLVCLILVLEVCVFRRCFYSRKGTLNLMGRRYYTGVKDLYIMRTAQNRCDRRTQNEADTRNGNQLQANNEGETARSRAKVI